MLPLDTPPTVSWPLPLPLDESRPALPHGPRVLVCGAVLDAITLQQAVGRILEWCEGPGSCRCVVTPNVDHLVLLHERADFRQVYAAADMVLADGWPVVLAARILQRPVPERVAGSDLVPALLATASAARPLRVYLLGAAPGVADRAASRVLSQYPGVKVVGTYSPPMGFERHPQENEQILALVAEAAPDLLILGFGAPKQELWLQAHRDRLAARVAICAGATIDFLAGEKQRAPLWMRRCGLEWCHRLWSEPRRLARRYARDALIFPRLLVRQWLHGHLSS